MARPRTSETLVLPGLAMDTPLIGSVEREAIACGYSWILGVDEVGRGPLAGPVTTAATLVSLADLTWCEGLNDSKRLTRKMREALDVRVRERAPSFAVQHVHVDDVDRLNVLGASLWGMRACAREVLHRMGLAPRDVLVVVDGKQTLLEWEGAQRAVVQGDARSFAVAAASVIAKVARDAHMASLDDAYPGYGFAKHAGYGTKFHMDALMKLGPSPEHRRSFAPVQRAIAIQDEKLRNNS